MTNMIIAILFVVEGGVARDRSRREISGWNNVARRWRQLANSTSKQETKEIQNQIPEKSDREKWVLRGYTAAISQNKTRGVGW